METKNNWSAQQWEEYLSSIEGKQTELLLNNPHMVEAMSEETFREGVSNLMGTNYSPQLNKIIGLLMESLTDKQKTVLHLIFWKTMSLREVADCMGISYGAVRRIRDRALVSLSKILLSYADVIDSDDEAA